MEFNKSKDKEYKLPCANCDNETCHKVLFSVEKSEVGLYDDSVDYFSEFQIIICQGCEEISFRSNWQASDGRCGRLNNQLLDHEELYPSRIAGRKELKSYYYLPMEIRIIYEETHSALCGGMLILARIGIRVLVEAICNDKKAKGKNLENKIDNLVEIGVLTKEGVEILHGTRLLGNQAAHKTKLIYDKLFAKEMDMFKVKMIEEKTLNEAMDVVEHLLIGAYILPEKTRNLPKRK